MTLEREVEPMTIKIFDMMIGFEISETLSAAPPNHQDSVQISRQREGITKEYELSLIGMKDDEFTLDYVSWTIK